MGLDPTAVAKQLSFFMNVKTKSFEEAAKYRALRRMWGFILKEGFGIADSLALSWRVQAYTGGTDLRLQKPHTNIIRDSQRTLTSVVSSPQGTNTTSFDEAIQIPSDLSQTVAIDTNHIVLNESGITEYIDPFGGSYYLEAFTNSLEHFSLI